MDYPRNPPPPQEQIKDERPSVWNVYSPTFTVPGGASGLSLDEYHRQIISHDPRVLRCIQKTQWYLLSFTIGTAIGGRYLGAYRNYKIPGQVMSSLFGGITGLIIGTWGLPQIHCEPYELNALHHAADLISYGEFKRDDGKENIFVPKGLEMEDEKFIQKGLEPPPKL